MAEPHAHSQPIETYGRAPHNRLRNAWPILLFALVLAVISLLSYVRKRCMSVCLYAITHAFKNSRIFVDIHACMSIHSFIHCRHLYSASSIGATQKRSQPQRVFSLSSMNLLC